MHWVWLMPFNAKCECQINSDSDIDMLKWTQIDISIGLPKSKLNECAVISSIAFILDHFSAACQKNFEIKTYANFEQLYNAINWSIKWNWVCFVFLLFFVSHSSNVVAGDLWHMQMSNGFILCNNGSFVCVKMWTLSGAPNK